MIDTVESRNRIKTDDNKKEELYIGTASSENIEMYLKAIWFIREKGEEVKVSSIARLFLIITLSCSVRNQYSPHRSYRLSRQVVNPICCILYPQPSLDALIWKHSNGWYIKISHIPTLESWP